MKVDYDKFPDIPPGYSTNYNKTRDVYQVYRDCRVTDPTTGKRSTSARRLARSRTASSATASFTWPDKKI